MSTDGLWTLRARDAVEAAVDETFARAVDKAPSAAARAITKLASAPPAQSSRARMKCKRSRGLAGHRELSLPAGRTAFGHAERRRSLLQGLVEKWWKAGGRTADYLLICNWPSTARSSSG